MPGCGKSLVGEELAKLLCCDWVDLDRAVEAAAGKTIPRIFREDGEPAFRALESRALQDLLSGSSSGCIDFAGYGGMVLSLGGGTILSPQNQSLILEHTTCIYLKAAPAELLDNIRVQANVQRPLLGTPTEESLSSLLEKRAPAYAKAHLTVETSWRTPLTIAQEISALLHSKS